MLYIYIIIPSHYHIPLLHPLSHPINTQDDDPNDYDIINIKKCHITTTSSSFSSFLYSQPNNSLLLIDGLMDYNKRFLEVVRRFRWDSILLMTQVCLPSIIYISYYNLYIIIIIFITTSTIIILIIIINRSTIVIFPVVIITTTITSSLILYDE